MSRLLEDPKVKAIVEKQIASAVKAERSRVLGIVKGIDVKGIEDKGAAKTAKAVLADVTAQIKAA